MKLKTIVMTDLHMPGTTAHAKNILYIFIYLDFVLTSTSSTQHCRYLQGVIKIWSREGIRLCLRITLLKQADVKKSWSIWHNIWGTVSGVGSRGRPSPRTWSSPPTCSRAGQHQQVLGPVTALTWWAGRACSPPCSQPHSRSSWTSFSAVIH